MHQYVEPAAMRMRIKNVTVAVRSPSNTKITLRLAPQGVFVCANL